MGGLGMPEIMIILVIALVVFGPRKLPELGKSLGKAMGQFKRASEDFKRTWEQEVDLEKTRTSISETSSSDQATSYDASHHSADGAYDPYNSDYGYTGDAAAATTETHPPTPAVTEHATAEVGATTPTPASTKAQPGQWI